jgi:hypothetical protein
VSVHLSEPIVHPKAAQAQAWGGCVDGSSEFPGAAFAGSSDHCIGKPEDHRWLSVVNYNSRRPLFVFLEVYFTSSLYLVLGLVTLITH